MAISPVTVKPFIRRPACPGCGRRGYFRHSRNEQGKERVTIRSPESHMFTWDMGLWCPDGTGCPNDGGVYGTFRELRAERLGWVTGWYHDD